MPSKTTDEDAHYLDVLLTPIRKCAAYKPKFGKDAEREASLESFTALYGSDPLYHWIGLDSPLVYAAHKAAGGMTSVYRQLGIGCERLIREVVKDQFALQDAEVTWSYDSIDTKGKSAKRTLDVKIELREIADAAARRRVQDWIGRSGTFLKLKPRRVRELRGVVLEVRQGYKSADSKRQTADLSFGLHAANDDFLAIFAVVSSQVSEPVIKRYRSQQILVLLGALKGTDVESTFTFMRDVVGYDLAAFFKRNSARMRDEMTEILKSLLTPD